MGVEGNAAEGNAAEGNAAEGNAEVRSQLIPLSLPVPPGLEEALGYGGSSRWTAFYWNQDGNELLWEDGRWTGDGEGSVWSAYLTHPAVAPHLEGLHLGGQGRVAEFYLVLDRQKRQFYAGEMLPVMRLLADQHSAPPTSEEIGVHISQAVQLMEREAESPPMPSQMSEWKEAQQRVEDEMLRWLDNKGEVMP